MLLVHAPGTCSWHMLLILSSTIDCQPNSNMKQQQELLLLFDNLMHTYFIKISSACKCHPIILLVVPWWIHSSYICWFYLLVLLTANQTIVRYNNSCWYRTITLTADAMLHSLENFAYKGEYSNMLWYRCCWIHPFFTHSWWFYLFLLKPKSMKQQQELLLMLC